MNLKKGMKLIALTSIAVIATISMTSCSFFGTSPQTTSSPSPSAMVPENPASPEKAIVGKWGLENIFNEKGESTSFSDIDLSNTPIANLSSILGSVLTTGSTIEFKEDKTIPLVVTKAEYSINGDKLKLSLPEFSQTAEFKYKVDGSRMTIDIYGNEVVLIKK